MSRTLTQGRAIGLGLVVTICVLVGGWVLARLGLREGLWRDTFELRVGFAQVHDIDKGTPVRIRGVDVGQVVAIEYPDEDPEDGQTKVWLRMQIDSKFQHRIYADAKATIHSKGMMSTNVIAISPGTPSKGPLFGDELASVEPMDLAQMTVKLSTVADRADAIMKDLQNSQGTIVKLLKDDGLYQDVRKLAQDTQKAVSKADTAITAMRDELNSVRSFIATGEEAIRTLQQDAEAIKKMPLVRGYVEDPVAILVKPDCDRQRQYFATDDLFEPDSSILSEGGRTHLTHTANWLNTDRTSASEVAVVTFHNPKDMDLSSSHAKALTQKRSETVVEFLRAQGVHKLGVWSRRKVTALGFGTTSSPILEKEQLPASHTQILLFIPRQ